jgi:hypothetical protein
MADEILVPSEQVEPVAAGTDHVIEELRGYAGSTLHHRSAIGPGAADLLLPIHIKKDDLELRLFSTLMTLGTPRYPAGARIETFFPADDSSERMWRRVAVEV